MSSISQFRAKVLSADLAKTYRYMVTVNDNKNSVISQLSGSNLNKLQFMCEQAEIPGKTLNAADIHIYGPNYKSPNEVLMNQSSLNFLVGADMAEKVFFDAWISYISGQANGYDMAFREDYATTIDITQFSDTDTIDDAGSLTVTLNDCFPTAVTPLNLTWSDDNFHRIMVDFVYTDYSIN